MPRQGAWIGSPGQFTWRPKSLAEQLLICVSPCQLSKAGVRSLSGRPAMMLLKGNKMTKDHQASRGSQDARRHKFDHATRDQWLDRDAALEAKWRASSMTREEFIRHNEELIDRAIAAKPDRDREDH